MDGMKAISWLCYFHFGFASWRLFVLIPYSTHKTLDIAEQYRTNHTMNFHFHGAHLIHHYLRTHFYPLSPSLNTSPPKIKLYTTKNYLPPEKNTSQIKLNYHEKIYTYPLTS